ncbi:MAG: cysteine synthase A [bacterium]|nr:cysteine synthase A [bacterium]
MRFDSIAQSIGHTPLVRLNRLSDDNSATIYLKMESFNPCSSVKDRIGLAMIEAAEKDGRLKPGMTIVEPTSGNTGIALAMVAASKGYKCVLSMPESMTLERRAIIKSLGAEIELTPADKGMNGAIAKAAEIAARGENFFYPSQFSNPANPAIHLNTTGPEIIADLDEIHLDAFVAGVGTGGTISGTGKALKKKYDCRVCAVEPDDSPVLSGGEPGPHKIQGIGAGFIPENYDGTVVDQVLRVTNDEAFETSRRLARQEGILAGISSGANVFAALKVASELGPDKVVVTVICDSGERYLTTALFESDF